MEDTTNATRDVPMIRGELVWLRPSERVDLPRFVRWLADGEVAHALAIRAPISVAMEERWFERMLEDQGKTSYHFVICRLDDGEPIGTVGLMDVNLVDGNAEFGIAIGEKRLWNRGYGTDALRAISDFGFGQLRLERIQLYCYAFNARGRRSYEKAGFTLEGTLRRAHFQDGRHHDVLLMSFLREEWAAQERPRSWE